MVISFGNRWKSKKITTINTIDEFISYFNKHHKDGIVGKNKYLDRVYSSMCDKKYTFKEFKGDLSSTIKNTFGGKKLSNVSKEYWLFRGYSNENVDEIIKNIQLTRNSKIPKEFYKNIKYNTKLSRCYWEKMGYSENVINEKMKAIQGRGKEFYLSKGYSDEDATNKVKQRTDKWLKSMKTAIDKDPSINKRKGKTYEELKNLHGIKKANDIIDKRLLGGVKYSNLSQIVINEIVNWANLDISKCQYGDNEFFTRDDCNIYFYDFRYENKIIEFNGDFWHMNPDYYSPNDINPITKKTAKDMWEYDSKKESIATTKGYDMITIWESDWYNNKEKVLQKIKDHVQN